MEVSGQNIVKCDEEKALKCLLDAFGSAFSLEEIASAYCKARRNVDLAGEILYEMQGSNSSTSATDTTSNADVKTEGSSESSDGYSFEDSCQERRNSRPKFRPVSIGTVSSVIGKDYGRPMPSVSGSFDAAKPTKLNAKSLPMTGIWLEKSKPNISKHDQLHHDMEDFLFKMLGDGFQLDRNMIREVLDTCGYDMQKSLDKLLDRSFKASDKRTAAVGSVGKFADMKSKSVTFSSDRKSQDLNYPSGDGNIVSTKRMELHQQQKEKQDLQTEVLSSLFNYRRHSEEAPKRIVKDLNKNSRYGHVVFEPPKGMEEYNVDMDFSRLQDVDDPEDEEDYQNVRRAVKEYRAAMNEYYKAAVDAFAKGDQIKAGKLLEQGQFFLGKAHEADKESSRMILQPRTSQAEEMVLDLRDHGSKEAIRLMKCHLSNLSGIPSFEYLKVIFDANDEGNTKGSRRRLQVLKLLEQESIKWVEGETAGTILIRLDNIDSKSLSFVKT
ncbi:hypothetical protein RJT34_13670 [Clitoria ternatea]|uniref:DUF1771 domain-containing protein n=1 Tax=Clitoria ternatea TaxID=43366 RepID=A0AAN9JR35_CLITE